MNRSRVVTFLAAAGVVAGSMACGSSASDDSAASAGATPQLAGEGWPFGEVKASLASKDGATAGQRKLPGGKASGEFQAGEDSERFREASDTQLGDRDPCSLITTGEVEAATAAAAGSVQRTVLEHGTACGYRVNDDKLRIAVAAFEFDGGTRWYAEDVGYEERVVAGHEAKWLTNYPDEVSNVLIVEGPTFDLVLEISTLGDEPNGSLRETAERLAEPALGRIA